MGVRIGSQEFGGQSVSANSFELKVQPRTNASAGVEVWGASNRVSLDVHAGEGTAAAALVWASSATGNKALAGALQALVPVEDRSQAKDNRAL